MCCCCPTVKPLSSQGRGGDRRERVGFAPQRGAPKAGVRGALIQRHLRPVHHLGGFVQDAVLVPPGADVGDDRFGIVLN